MGIENKYIEARNMLLKFVSDTAKEKGITQQEIANRTGWKRTNVNRILTGKYSPSLDNFLRLAESVGVYFFVESKDSDSDHARMMRTRHDRPGDKN